MSSRDAFSLLRKLRVHCLLPLNPEMRCLPILLA